MIHHNIYYKSMLRNLKQVAIFYKFTLTPDHFEGQAYSLCDAIQFDEGLYYASKHANITIGSNQTLAIFFW